VDNLGAAISYEKAPASTQAVVTQRSEFGSAQEVKMMSFDFDQERQLLEMFAPAKPVARAPEPLSEQPSQPPIPVNDAEIDRTWLKRKCEEYLHQTKTAQSPSLQELTLSLCEILASPRENEEIQSELFDLLGFESFPLVESLLKNRDLFLEVR